MTQYAIVKKLTGPAKAEVEVLRGTACGDDCASCQACNYASRIRVEAANEAAAGVGDRVEIETQSSRIFGAAFLVYVLPFILFFVGYAAAAGLSLAEGMRVLVSFLFFAAGMAAAVIAGRRMKRNPITYRITHIVEHGADL